MRQDEFTFRREAKPFVIANMRPLVRHVYPAMRARIRLIPFAISFLGREDRSLPEKLRAEGPAILADLIRAAQRVIEHGMPACPRSTPRARRATSTRWTTSRSSPPNASKRSTRSRTHCPPTRAAFTPPSISGRPNAASASFRTGVSPSGCKNAPASPRIPLLATCTGACGLLRNRQHRATQAIEAQRQRQRPRRQDKDDAALRAGATRPTCEGCAGSPHYTYRARTRTYTDKTGNPSHPSRTPYRPAARHRPRVRPAPRCATLGPRAPRAPGPRRSCAGAPLASPQGTARHPRAATTRRVRARGRAPMGRARRAPQKRGPVAVETGGRSEKGKGPPCRPSVTAIMRGPKTPRQGV